MGWLSKSKEAGTAEDPAPALATADHSDGEFEKNSQPEPASDAEELAFIDPVVEERIVRKLDWNVMPLVFVLYLLAYLDRSNIGNARIAGMTQDLNLYGDRYDWFLTIFYISYILFEPTILLFKILPPHWWMAATVFGWGVVATAQAGAQSWAGEMVLRFLMGAFEAGYGPGTTYYLTFLYKRRELGFRQGIFLSAAPLATTFAGILAYGITSGHASIANWRLLFLVEGLPTICMAPIAFFFCPDTPQSARFLSPVEKKVAEARTVRQNGVAARRGNFSLTDSLRTLLDVKPWLTALMYFSCNVSFSSLPVFLPTIITDMGFNAVNSQGLSAPPYFVAFLATLATSYIADRTQQRGLMVMALSALGGVGYIILATAKNVGARYFATYVAAAGVFPSIANILPWVMNNQGSDSRRGAAVVLLNLVGQCGPLLGTRVYNNPPYYVTGQSVCAAFMFFTTILAFTLRAVCAAENRKLDRRYGPVEELAAADGGEENEGPAFRYVL